jgi:hypothetical protein
MLIQSPLLSSHLYLEVTFSCPVIEKYILIEPLLRGHLSYKATFSSSQRGPLNTGLTIHHTGQCNVCCPLRSYRRTTHVV